MQFQVCGVAFDSSFDAVARRVFFGEAALVILLGRLIGRTLGSNLGRLQLRLRSASSKASRLHHVAMASRQTSRSDQLDALVMT